MMELNGDDLRLALVVLAAFVMVLGAVEYYLGPVAAIGTLGALVLWRLAR